MKVFMVVGEDSGDSLGAGLISALEDNHGEALECLGVGGPKMKAAGFDELLPFDQISVVGIWEVLPKIHRILKLNMAIVEEIEKRQPDVVVTIDFPDFNFILGKRLKKRGKYTGKLVHYVSPSVWAWRPARAKNVSLFLDGMMCLFPVEPEHYTKHGLKAKFVGHPIVAENLLNIDPTEFRLVNDIKPEDKTLGLFLGSRENELKKLAPIIRQAALYVKEILPEISVIVPTLPKTEFEVQRALAGCDMPMVITSNPLVKWEAFKACDVAIAVSGTVALELACAGVPHIITYKVNPITAFILRGLVKIKHIHLANILLGKDIVPEFLQRKCEAGQLAQGIIKLMKDKSACDAQVAEFSKLYALLGGGDDKTPSQKAAEFVTDIVKGDGVKENKAAV